MRALLVVLVLVVAGFDHAKHATSTQDALTCTNCHAITKTGTLAGKPAHAQCFGKCHGAPPPARVKGKPAVLVDPPRAVVCKTCHGGTPSVDFALALGHKRHAQITCDKCHAQQKPAPHTRCAGCHGSKKAPPMTLCTICHLLADPSQLQPPANISVQTAFSHPKHAARGAKCTVCHFVDTDARALPHPTMQQCSTASCHDAKGAFPTTDTCTKCHQDVPPIKFALERPDAPFSHAFHAPYVAFVPCTSCHAVEKSGEVALPRHADCAPCHDDDFAKRAPMTCGACHDATEPWRKLLPDRPSQPRTDFGTSLDHAKHPEGCASCHSLTTISAQLRPPRGHSACSGKTCHAASSGPAPQFAECDGCHELGIAARREAQRVNAEWSVRQRFVHGTHQRALDGSALACTACHIDMTANDLMSIATPPKPTCVACHDGKTSFKLTGTGCARCHPGGRGPT